MNYCLKSESKTPNMEAFSKGTSYIEAPVTYIVIKYNIISR